MVKNEFSSTFNNNPVNLELWEVTPKIQRESEVITNKAFQKGINEDKLLLAAEIDSILAKRNFDFEAESKQIDEISGKIRQATVELLAGKVNGRPITKLEGRALALSIQKLRQELDEVGQTRSALYQRTAERYADGERTSYTLYATIIDPKSGKPFFKSFEDFKENLNSPVVRDALDILVRRITNGNTNVEARHPENKWLIKHKFMNEKLQLINEKGHACDEDFRLIDENGYYINDTGQRVDKYGNRLDDNGELLIVDDPTAYQN